MIRRHVPLRRRFLNASLSAILGTDPWTESILGDLHEEYARLAAASRPLARPRADVWYCLQALALGARCAGARASRGDCHAPTGRSPSPRRPTEIPSCAHLGLETRYAFRTLWKRPGSARSSILTLALGLGANAAVFAIIDALILRPFTIPDVDRVAMVAETSPQDGFGARETVSPANFLDWKRQTDVFERLAAFAVVGREPRRRRRSGAGLGLPRLSRLLPRAAASSPRSGGRSRPTKRRADGTGARSSGTTSGNAASGATAPSSARAILLDTEPYESRSASRRRRSTFRWARKSGRRSRSTRPRPRGAVAIPLGRSRRLAPGRSVDDAQAQMAVIAGRLEQQYPEANRGRGAQVSTLVEGMRDQGLGPILALWQASAVVRAAHRLREHREPAARARRRAAARPRGAPGDRREPRPAGPRAAPREHAARRRDRPASRWRSPGSASGCSA